MAMGGRPSFLLLLAVMVIALLFGDNSQAFYLVPIPRRRQVPRAGQFFSTGGKQKRTSSYYTWRRNGNGGRILEIAAAASSSAVSGSTVELIEPETGCHVILLGCFHGSQSSADDVSACITNDTNVVCMELCASRFEDLRRDLLQDQQQEQQEAAAKSSGGGTRLPASSKKKMWIFRFAEMVQRKVQSRGLSTGVAAALLGGVSGMQTALSGLEPGLEFRRALEQVQSISTSSNNTRRSCDIVLADQNVDETLQKVGQLPSLAVDMWKDCLQHGWESSCGIEASALKTALAGSSSSSNKHKLQQVTIWNFLTRNQAAVRDMGRLVLPPVLLLNALTAWTTTTTHDSSFLDWPVGAATASTAQDFALLSPMAQDAVFMTMAGVAANWLFLFFLYVSVALPVARVVLRERDDTLASGIRQACHLALQQQQRQQQSINEMESAAPLSPIRVVAVLGYLHVNGVAERLLKNQQQQQNDAPDQAVATCRSPEI